jgi:hypothetical protein
MPSCTPSCCRSARLQRRGGARRDAQDRRRPAGGERAARRVRPGGAASARRPRSAPSACARPTSTAPPTWRCRPSTRTRGRSSGRRCASCCSAPGKASARLRSRRATRARAGRAQAVSRFTPFSSQA